MYITHRKAKIDDLKTIVAMLADDDLGRNREQADDSVAQTYIDAFAKIDKDPN